MVGSGDLEHQGIDRAVVKPQSVKPHCPVRLRSTVGAGGAEVNVVRVAGRFMKSIGHQRHVDERLGCVRGEVHLPDLAVDRRDDRRPAGVDEREVVDAGHVGREMFQSLREVGGVAHRMALAVAGSMATESATLISGRGDVLFHRTAAAASASPWIITEPKPPDPGV